jgi:hypothetical protein
MDQKTSSRNVVGGKPKVSFGRPQGRVSPPRADGIERNDQYLRGGK